MMAGPIDSRSTWRRRLGRAGDRPCGAVRDVIVEGLRQNGPMTMRDIAEHCQVGYDAARTTNAVRAQVIQIVGSEKRAHCDKWVAIYDLVPERGRDGLGGAALLEAAMFLWAR
jgi:bacterioferritin-associated ferredoxin